MKRIIIIISLTVGSAKAQVFLNKSEKNNELSPEKICWWSHRVATNGSLYMLPTSVRGFTDIGDLNAQLLVACEPEELHSGYTVFAEAEIQSHPKLLNQVASQQFPVRIQQLNLGNLDSESGFRVGLLWDPWIHSAHQMWRYHLSQNDFRSLVSRVALLPDQEVGAQIQMVTESQQIGLRISTGESWPNPELGPNKDLMIWWKTRPDLTRDFYFLFYSRYGRVDFVDRQSNEKSRTGIQLAYLGLSNIRGYFSLMHHSSGVDGLNYQQQSPRISPQFGEGMDLVPLGGQTIKGLVGDWFLSYFLDENQKAEIFYRMSEARLNQVDPLNYLTSSQFGCAFTVNLNARVVLFLSNTEYGKGFSIGTQNRQLIGATLEVFR